MKILGVIVNYRTPDLSLEAARFLAEQLEEHDAHAGAPGRSAVLIVDNDSPDDSEERIRGGLAGPWSEMVSFLPSGRNGGFGFGNNVGIRHGLDNPSPPDLFYFLNPDARPDPGAVAEVTRFLAGNPGVGILGTGVHRGDHRLRKVAFRFPSLPSELDRGLELGPASRLLSRWSVNLPLPEAPVSCDWVTGSSMVVRRSVFEAVGYFDEGFFLYFEEIDLCRRAKGAGFEVVHLPTASVAHEQGAATGVGGNERRVPGYWFESRWRYFRKHHGIPYALGASAGWAAGRALHTVVDRLRGRSTPAPPKVLPDFLTHTGRAAWRSVRGEDPEETW